MTLFLFARITIPWNSQKMHQYAAWLPERMQQQLQQQWRWQDQQAGLAGKLLLRRGLQQLGSSATLSHIHYTNHHRPYLPGDIDFNVSHAGDYSVCVLSDESRVGVDIERLHPVELHRFKSLWTEEEWQEITTADVPHHRLYTYWTQKEAVVKADGRGLYINPQHISIHQQQARIEDTSWHLRRIDIDDQHIAHIASSSPLPDISKLEIEL